jgi:hypothetical protein
MSKGIQNVQYVGSASQVMVENQPNWTFLYQASTVKDSKFNVGDRVTLPDGRVFRFSLAAGTCNPEVGAYNPQKTFANAVAPAQSVIQSPIQGQVIQAGALGSTVVTMTVAAGGGSLGTGVVAVDELRGGYIVVGNGANQHPQFRGIIGNSAVAAGGGSCDVYLDAALTTAVTVGTTNIETLLNPYAGLKGDNAGGAYVSFLGLPAVVATVGQYFWLQTWGPVWVTSDSLTADDADDRVVYFVDNGSLKSRTDAGGTLFQPAGFCMDASSAGSSNAPMVMLQISI